MTASESWYPDPRIDPIEPVPYACVLDEQPIYTCPAAAGAWLPSWSGAILAAPGLAVRDAQDLGLGDAFRPGPVAVTSSATALPFWLDRDGLVAVQALLNGTADELPLRWRHLLVAAELAVPKGDLAAPPLAVPSRIQEQTWASGDQVCVLLRGLVHPFHLGSLRLHTRRLVRTGLMRDGDAQTPMRWVQNDEPVASWVHKHLSATVSAVLGQAVKPSYVYTATYHDGADLPMHVDREQCRFTVSLCIDCLPEPFNEIPWPLMLQPLGGRLRVYQRLGDALLYGGQDIPHSRPQMPAGLTVTALFLHYVAEDFTGRLK
ncbi:hypothetical protein [Streptomyces nigra]|uniref:hypothetical protein n=1 Tax=Streptomyces nigra TaxID=1827580 RepID=UPI0037F31857